MKIAICIPTFRRPDQLRALLDSLVAQSFTDNKPHLHVIVVDNDDQGEGQRVVDQTDTPEHMSLLHLHEPMRGVVAVRNRALQNIPDDTSWIAFVDDDESAHPDWLQELLRVSQEFDADVVTGPVERTLPDDAPDWLREGAFFNRIERKTGTLVDRAYTNNVMLSAALLREHDLQFDERYGRSGGEDVQFFRRLHDLGARIVWANEAIVQEPVADERCSGRWIVGRSWRIGTAMARIECGCSGWFKGAAVMWRSACNKIPTGLWMFITRGLFNKAKRIEGMRLIALGFGHALGTLGIRPQGYA